MKTITYAGDSLVTGDEIAHAVMEYARVLANLGRADTVDIPARGDDGHTVMTTMLIGPASQIVAGQSDGTEDELRDDDVVAELKRRARAAESPTAVVDGTDGGGPYLSDFEFDAYSEKPDDGPPRSGPRPLPRS